MARRHRPADDEEQFINAVREVALITEDDDSAYMTIAEMAARLQMTEKAVRARIGVMVADGRVHVKRVWRTRISGDRQRYPGYRLVQ